MRLSENALLVIIALSQGVQSSLKVIRISTDLDLLLLLRREHPQQKGGKEERRKVNKHIN